MYSVLVSDFTYMINWGSYWHIRLERSWICPPLSSANLTLIYFGNDFLQVSCKPNFDLQNPKLIERKADYGLVVFMRFARTGDIEASKVVFGRARKHGGLRGRCMTTGTVA